MRPIDKQVVDAALREFTGQIVYIHCEVTPGGFIRNARVDVLNNFIAGEGPYRVALELAGDGWVRVEGLTDYERNESDQLLMAGHDDKGRLTVALELSKEPFEK